jgi:hypothetical protein
MLAFASAFMTSQHRFGASASLTSSVVVVVIAAVVVVVDDVERRITRMLSPSIDLCSPWRCGGPLVLQQQQQQ